MHPAVAHANPRHHDPRSRVDLPDSAIELVGDPDLPMTERHAHWTTPDRDPAHHLAGLVHPQQLLIGGVGDPGGSRAVGHPAGPPSTGHYGGDGVSAAVYDS